MMNIKARTRLAALAFCVLGSNCRASDVPARCSSVAGFLRQTIGPTATIRDVGQGQRLNKDAEEPWAGVISCLVEQSSSPLRLANIVHTKKGDYLLSDILPLIPNWRGREVREGDSFFASSSPVTVLTGSRTWAIVRSLHLAGGEVGSLRLIDHPFELTTSSPPISLPVMEGYSSGDGGELWFANNRFQIDQTGALGITETIENHEPRIFPPPSSIPEIYSTTRTTVRYRIRGNGFVAVTTETFTGLTTISAIDWVMGTINIEPFADTVEGILFDSNPIAVSSATRISAHNVGVRVLRPLGNPFFQTPTDVWEVETTDGMRRFCRTSALRRMSEIAANAHAQ